MMLCNASFIRYCGNTSFGYRWRSGSFKYTRGSGCLSWRPNDSAWRTLRSRLITSLLALMQSSIFNMKTHLCWQKHYDIANIPVSVYLRWLTSLPENEGRKSFNEAMTWWITDLTVRWARHGLSCMSKKTVGITGLTSVCATYKLIVR